MKALLSIRTTTGRVLLAALIGASSMLISGCSPEHNGFAGLGLDEDGKLIGLIKTCGDDMNGAALYHWLYEDGKSTHTKRDVEWRSAEPITDTARWKLDGSDPNWHADRPFPDLDPSTEYHFIGVSGGISTYIVDLTAEDLANLSPGQVIDNGERIVSEEEFFARPCHNDDTEV